MDLMVTRQCGCREKITFRGSNAAWKEREAVLKRLPCSKCHTARLRERVAAGAPTLTELCSGEVVRGE